jgi:cation transport ATPase
MKELNAAYDMVKASKELHATFLELDRRLKKEGKETWQRQEREAQRAQKEAEEREAQRKRTAAEEREAQQKRTEVEEREAQRKRMEAEEAEKRRKEEQRRARSSLLAWLPALSALLVLVPSSLAPFTAEGLSWLAALGSQPVVVETLPCLAAIVSSPVVVESLSWLSFISA